MEDDEPQRLVRVKLGANQSETHHIVTEDKQDLPDEGKLEFLYEGSIGERTQRSFAGERPRQILRWIATVLFAKLPNAVEVQCYWHASAGQLWVSTNKWSENKKIGQTVAALILERGHFQKATYEPGRLRRHAVKLLSRRVYQSQQGIHNAFFSGNVNVPLDRYPPLGQGDIIDLHAERRIQRALNVQLDPNYLAGVKRPCMICARALSLLGARPGPLWNSAPGLVGYDIDEALDHAVANGVITHVTRDRYTQRLDTGHDTDSDSGNDL